MIVLRSSVLRAAALAAAVALVVPAAVEAGRGGGGGGGGGYRGGGGYGGGYRGGYGGYGGYGRGYGYGGYGRGYGYGGYGFGLGFYGGYGLGYYGGYGAGYSPFYGYDSFGSYPYVAGTFDSPALIAGTSVPQVNTQRNYPPDIETAPPPVESDRAMVAVRLPADAILMFQGTAMRLTGPERVFRSPPLQPGKSYRYDVTARWTENGKPVEKNRSITVQAGQRATLDLMTDE
jgi:uncharacterized protein (TIGR03000 family)